MRLQGATLTEPDVSLSAHPAPIVQPAHTQNASEQIAMVGVFLYASAIAAPHADVLVSVCIFDLPTSTKAYPGAKELDKALNDSNCHSS
jgi:hypothetical protein